jgi:hypothetical protein
MRVKGSMLRARCDWVREKGPEAWSAFEAALSEASREAVDTVVSAGWYDFDVFVDVCETLDRLHGKGDLALVETLARDACDRNLTTLYRVFLKVGTPTFTIKRASAMWRTNYDEGSFEIEETGERRLRGEIKGIEKPSRVHCLSVKGWALRALELAGGRTVSVTESCRALGHPVCEFWLEWR